jgi:hypothetical protein
MVDEQTKCGQVGCNALSVVRCTWPGRDEMGLCEAHAIKADSVARAMGLHLQLIPLGAQLRTALPSSFDDVG